MGVREPVSALFLLDGHVVTGERFQTPLHSKHSSQASQVLDGRSENVANRVLLSGRQVAELTVGI